MRQLRFAVFLLGLTTICSSFSPKPCNWLADGKYEMKYANKDPRIGNNRIIIEQNEVVRTYGNGVVIRGKLKWIADCLFVLDNPGRIIDTSGAVGNLINKSFGESCIELMKKSNDTVFFRTTYAGNLHVTQNEGIMIKTRS